MAKLEAYMSSKKRSIIESPSSNKKNQPNVSSLREPLSIISNATDVSRSNKTIRLTNSTTSQIGQDYQQSALLSTFNATGQSGLVSSTRTLHGPLSDKKMLEMMFLHERQQTANTSNTNQRQQIIYSDVNVSSTYQLTPLSNITRQNITSSSNISTPGCSATFNTFSVGSSSTQRTSHINVHMNEPIRMPNLDEFEENDAPATHGNVYEGISIAYLDHGDQKFMCGMCNALLWEAESKRGKTNNGITTYSLCCSYGDVQLPEMKSAPLSYGYGIKFRSIRCPNNYLKDMLDSKNPLVKSYRMARDCFQQNPNMDLKLKIIGTRQTDARTYNLPTTYEVAALIVGDIGEAIDKRDIIVTTQSGALQRISELHPCYVPLQYPIFFPYGEDGYRIDIAHRELRGSTKRKRKKCTMREFFSYRFQDRPHDFSLILNGGRLTQQLFVDAYTMIETQRLHYIRTQQKNLRSETYENLRNIHSVGSSDVSNAGQRIILPLSFTRGARYMMQNYLDAMTIFVYTIEFQKRGFPHAHICLFLHSEHKIHNPENIDKFISAEIPDPNEDPELYSLVSDHMMHGPCGVANPKCSCMVDNCCSKKFPKKFQNETSIDSNGFPVYRRRDLGNVVVKSGVNLDNRHVVPFNTRLLKKYQAHINVEWCNQEGSIKYLFKYTNKGPDRATISLVQDKTDDQGQVVDEVKEFYDCRYLFACEAAWRIFAFDVHYRVPSVTRLPFHLPGQQTVVFADDDDVEDVLNKPSVSSSKFIAWMECNKQYALARTLTYAEFPIKFVWKPDERAWDLRKRGFSIGRVHHVPPSFNEAYYLRILLNKVKGPMCFEDIRTVDGEVCDTYRDACYKRVLLDDDNEYIEAIEEASHTASGYYLRSLFATMLITYSLSRPDDVWEKCWHYLIDGILYKQQNDQKNPDLVLSESQLKNLALLEIENFRLGNNCTLRCFPTMPFPDDDSVFSSTNRFMNEELAYDIEVMTGEFERLFISLTDEQRDVYNQIMEVVDQKRGGIYFVYGYGGTGKTFLWKTLSASIRSKRKIVLNVASSDICNLIKKTDLIIWDEAPMIHKHAFETLDRTLKDVIKDGNRSNCQHPFGGKVIVFGDDFRQILPVVQNGSRSDIVNASLSSSHIWTKCKVLRLTKNMRLTVGYQSSNLEDTIRFAEWLLELGEGKLGGDNDGNAIIEIPDDLLICDSNNPLSDLIDFVYPALLERCNDISYFQERAILAPLNEVVKEINDQFLSIFPGEEVEYLSSDSLDNSESVGSGFDSALHSPDFLNE
ncbi:uncharacterized protein LOC143535580 [Bidens hawaiensis]|uniref:uncharacterized protein LOC143535580 n=1 Tax=Bidens hawaiensis TaxID=980011 RepID=UPI00404B971A